VIIAVEGPDLAGKTTLLEAIRTMPTFRLWPVLRLNISRHALTDGAILEEQSRAWNEALVTFSKHASAILDRCYVTSYCYSKLFGRTADLTYLSRISKELRPVVLYCSPSPETLLKRLEERGDSMMDRYRLVALKAIYDRWYVENTFDDTIVNVNTDQPVAQIVEAIEPWLISYYGTPRKPGESAKLSTIGGGQ